VAKKGEEGEGQACGFEGLLWRQPNLGTGWR